MRFFVKSASGESHVIPCSDASVLVEKLKEAAVKRLCSESDGCRPGSYELVLAGTESIISDQDVVGDVLQDGDCLILRGANGIPEIGANCCGGGSISANWCCDDSANLPTYTLEVCYALGNGLKKAQWIELDGCSLSIPDLIKIGNGQYRVKLSEAAKEAVSEARTVVDDIVDNHKVVYGITTGFGKFARVHVPEGKLTDLQERLIRSHAAGVGPPLPPHQVRRLLTLRINVLAKGFSGIRLETVNHLIAALNASCLPYIPLKGTVGASGDLAPLSHLALGMVGEGYMWSPTTGWGLARDVLNAHNLQGISLAPKEGLALINGTQFISGLGAEAVYRADLIARQADVIAALSIEALQGTPRAFDYDIHANRPHPGQQLVASRLRALLDSNVHPSEIRANHIDCGRVQDPYTMRCVPQVHGVVCDTINFVSGIITTEMNSALDNPMVFAARKDVISGGNFHGEYPAKAMDYLAIGVHELANMSERRQERLINPAYSDLPAFLVEEGGINSGFMVAHCTSASLVSENKVLTHPSSVDSISTSAGTEDHVSMGGFAARKALDVVKHVEQVLAIELLAACQALEFHRPTKTTAPLEGVHQLVRSVIKAWDKDRYFAPDIAAATNLLIEGKVWEVVEPYIKQYNAEFVPAPPHCSATQKENSSVQKEDPSVQSLKNENGNKDCRASVTTPH